MKVGLFAVIGGNAAEVAPFASPVTFRPAAEVAKEMVSLLREQEQVDLVVCISHCGLWTTRRRRRTSCSRRQSRAST